MSQHDYNIANAGGAAVRSDMNNALTAIQSLNSGTTAPTATKPFMPWYDTSVGALKMRNAGDTDWISMAEAVGGLSLRNKIINGNMGIAQRGTAAVTTNLAYGPVDRWQTSNGGDTFSTTQGSFVSGDTLFDTGGAQYFTQVAVTSVAGAGNYCIWIQKIEDVRILAGQTVTVSFWAKAASGTPSIGVGLDQSFGTGGSPTADATGTGQAQALTTTWAQYSKTFTVPSINGKTLGTTANTSYTQLVFWLDAGSTFNTRSGSIGQASKTVSIAQVQLEVGAVATPFEHRPNELALCQRYYETGTTYANSYSTAGNGMAMNYPYKATKRAAPLVVYVSPSYTNASAISSAGSTAEVLVSTAVITATGPAVFNSVFTSSAEL